MITSLTHPHSCGQIFKSPDIQGFSFQQCVISKSPSFNNLFPYCSRISFYLFSLVIYLICALTIYRICPGNISQLVQLGSALYILQLCTASFQLRLQYSLWHLNSYAVRNLADNSCRFTPGWHNTNLWSDNYRLSFSAVLTACRLRALRIIFPATGFFLLLQHPTSYRLRALRIILPVTRKQRWFFLLFQQAISCNLQALRMIVPATRQCWFFPMLQLAISYNLLALQMIVFATSGSADSSCCLGI